jgi:hypothetical protein
MFFDTLLPPTPKPPKYYLSLRVSEQNSMWISHLPLACYTFRQSRTANNSLISEEYKLRDILYPHSSDYEHYLRSQCSEMKRLIIRKKNRRFGGTHRLHLQSWRNPDSSLGFCSACCLLLVGFMISLLFYHEDGGDMFVWNLWLYRITRPYDQEYHIIHSQRCENIRRTLVPSGMWHRVAWYMLRTFLKKVLLPYSGA